ncbi:hypothetical protein [Rhizobium ruizarguesonis]|uniref:hypothetical protein n=1 Tax=Rhizobium ruizarguesonis TaxID=2081791 RepID=UPI0013BF7B89|nr:hypothetical protein [Rhizobium ruizarguesonis]NEH32639.1 hypothetical protein [Rhizobium ruizarguesonis]NEK07459.1 hypothetical protein [Rhizobium ruizarguesonis]
MTKKTKKCFVVGPIGDDDSEDRIHADWLLEDIITPVFDEHFKAFDVTRADKISNPGQITSQVITSLLDAELVIADLTTLNPNAFYEIGIRHTIQKPIIHMHLEGQRIPFDIAPFRSIKFSRRRPVDIRAARALLLAAVVEATKEDHEVDNPVTFSRGKVQFAQTATPAEKLIEVELANVRARIDGIEDKFSGYIRPRSKAEYQSLGLGPDMEKFRLMLREIKKIFITVRLQADYPQEGFFKKVEKMAANAFQKFGIENGGEYGRELMITVDDNPENRTRAEQFRNNYHGDEIQISVISPAP